jgi:hypothetical protein
MRLYYPLELQSRLRDAGFQIEAVYGNHDRSPFTTTSPHHLVVCSAG